MPHLMQPIHDPPTSIQLEGQMLDPATGKWIPLTDHLPIERRTTAQMALNDWATLWQLVEMGSIQINPQTRQATTASAETIAENLYEGDFYPDGDVNPTLDYWDDMLQPGIMRAFAWPLLLQSAGLVDVVHDTLCLSAKAIANRAMPAEQMIRLLWQHWLDTPWFDEFSRITSIQGQEHAVLTAPTQRRQLIARALASLPRDRWVSFDDFSEYMRTSSWRFTITNNLWDLYVLNDQYGRLGYQGVAEWPVVEGRYLLVFLFEYAATLGLIDIAFTPPVDARGDYATLWGADDLRCLSQYDGLRYLRLNELGAWCVGLTPSYTPPAAEPMKALEIRDPDEIIVLATLSPSDRLFLERFATSTGENRWRLDRETMLQSIEQGIQISDVKTYLTKWNQELLPAQVLAWLQDLQNCAEALKAGGEATLIEVRDALLAQQIANDKRMSGLCLFAGNHTLVVPVATAQQFRMTLHQLGYPVPSR